MTKFNHKNTLLFYVPTIRMASLLERCYKKLIMNIKTILFIKNKNTKGLFIKFNYLLNQFNSC